MAIITKHLYEGGGFRCSSTLFYHLNIAFNQLKHTIYLINTQNVRSEALATSLKMYDFIWWRHNYATLLSLYKIYSTSKNRGKLFSPLTFFIFNFRLKRRFPIFCLAKELKLKWWFGNTHGKGRNHDITFSHAISRLTPFFTNKMRIHFSCI